ncbi:hypothetical protein ASPACDRAFT_41976 [Aspergillus aculeatus ATCC 16872]|uniref:Cytoplasmic tRNA 2-thiolation protein 2 n=1 Tax=Aspergillus aculeatus (strain ATCC 16872 / CBS 172.66 / WB 5094) TaxID=690307 RepID=A0A1L9WZW5_ASPA1|nr:uncharacterized protein ASPACDRAFT_41976 [Aspergillus aculeatus ATCC 16872]OJK01713.1 hypothetical protein ASPACDRAFT_41976 [Aspergillus aculeatus ATCC 16872]
MPGKEIPERCMNCREAQPAFILRSRHVCQDCYIRFVKYKPFKRTENYRLRRNMPQDGPCKLLLPLSYGLSSTVMLHMLHEQVETMRLKPHGPKGYELLVLTIDPSTINPSIPPHDEAFSLAEKRFPHCSFTTVPFHSIFDYDPSISEVMSLYAHAKFEDQTSLSNQERLEAFRSSITSATSKADVDNILINRLIVAFAKKMECRGIVWGDSDSKLAAKTLANVAKGRGSAVTWQVCDGISPSGLEYNFPLRDLFTVELRNYASFIPELSDLIIPHQAVSENTLTKNLSIDELMVRYVLTQGEKYPGVMLNVTRTASKLQSPSASPAEQQCSLCGALMFKTNATSPQATGQHSDSLSSQICYACARSRPDLSC